jgi:predicted TIM-barrel fold metal-dependent hydrolase
MKALLKRHTNVPIIWAHCGVGRIVRPVKQHAAMLEGILSDPSMRNVYFDISWDEVAKYIVSSPESLQITAGLINRYPDRFLFGTDEVAPTSQEKYLKVYVQYDPLWRALTAEASEKVRKSNYELRFDKARRNVRNWEKANSGHASD